MNILIFTVVSIGDSTLFLCTLYGMSSDHLLNLKLFIRSRCKDLSSAQCPQIDKIPIVKYVSTHIKTFYVEIMHAWAT